MLKIKFEPGDFSPIVIYIKVSKKNTLWGTLSNPKSIMYMLSFSFRLQTKQ
jgi:hypothetical protein